MFYVLSYISYTITASNAGGRSIRAKKTSGGTLAGFEISKKKRFGLSGNFEGQASRDFW